MNINFLILFKFCNVTFSRAMEFDFMPGSGILY